MDLLSYIMSIYTKVSHIESPITFLRKVKIYNLY